jgi:hypothetical protein
VRDGISPGRGGSCRLRRRSYDHYPASDDVPFEHGRHDDDRTDRDRRWRHRHRRFLGELLSFLLLGLLAVLGVWLQRRVTRIEQQRREEEIRTQKRADLTARFDSKPNPNPRLRVPEYRLVLHNLGPAAARDVRFKIVALGDAPPPTLADGRASDFANAQPIALMDPGGEFPLQVLVLAGTARIVDVALHWTDEEGPKEKVLPLSLS